MKKFLVVICSVVLMALGLTCFAACDGGSDMGKVQANLAKHRNAGHSVYCHDTAVLHTDKLEGIMNLKDTYYSYGNSGIYEDDDFAGCVHTCTCYTCDQVLYAYYDAWDTKYDGDTSIELAMKRWMVQHKLDDNGSDKALGIVSYIAYYTFKTIDLNGTVSSDNAVIAVPATSYHTSGDHTNVY